jgi:hypothetical protein
MNADKAAKSGKKAFVYRFIRECEASDFFRVQIDRGFKGFTGYSKTIAKYGI